MATTITCTDDIGDDLITAIGRIVVRFGQLEHVVALTIKRTSPGMTLSEAVALTNGIVERSKYAQASFEQWAMDQHRERDFMLITEAVRDVARRRNNVIHAVWGKDTDGNVVWSRKGTNTTPTLDELEALQIAIIGLILGINYQTHPDLFEVEVQDELDLKNEAGPASNS